MIVRKLQDVIGTDREVLAANWTSRRLLLAQEGMGFSLHDTVIHPGTQTLIHYKHHLEAVYCIEGEGEVEVLETGRVYPIQADTVYALDGNERHLLRARTRMRMICVFNPALTGRETHGPDGAYPPACAAAGAEAEAVPTGAPTEAEAVPTGAPTEKETSL